jgi:hypothetical protein
MKVLTTCQNCGQSFYRAPSFHRNAEARGSVIKFCSRTCTDKARTAGIIRTKKRTGKTLTCEVCKTIFYRPQSMIEAGKARFCSEPCRLRAHELKMVDRTAPRPQTRRGAEITCVICGTSRYRKLSMIDRNINKTCGKPVCVSAYSRGLWGLPPRTYRKERGKRKVRRTNFTAANRRDWLGTFCERCNTTKNLTLDHRVPVCAGGMSVKENAQTLCGPCNNWKAKHVDKNLSLMQARSGG